MNSSWINKWKRALCSCGTFWNPPFYQASLFLWTMTKRNHIIWGDGLRVHEDMVLAHWNIRRQARKRQGGPQPLPTTSPRTTPCSVVPATVYRAVMASSPTMARYRFRCKDCWMKMAPAYMSTWRDMKLTGGWMNGRFSTVSPGSGPSLDSGKHRNIIWCLFFISS